MFWASRNENYYMTHWPIPKSVLGSTWFQPVICFLFLVMICTGQEFPSTNLAAITESSWHGPFWCQKLITEFSLQLWTMFEQLFWNTERAIVLQYRTILQFVDLQDMHTVHPFKWKVPLKILFQSSCCLQKQVSSDLSLSWIVLIDMASFRWDTRKMENTTSTTILCSRFWYTRPMGSTHAQGRTWLSLKLLQLLR